MENKRKLYIDEMREEPKVAPMASQEATEGGSDEKVGNNSGLGSAGPETTATSVGEAAGGVGGAIVSTGAQPVISGGALDGKERPEAEKKGLKQTLAKVPKKTWVLAGILAVVMIGAIVTVALMMGGGSSSNSGNKKPDTSIGDNSGNNDDKQDPDEPGDEGDGEEEEKPGDGMITLSTGDARVQKLYSYFARLGFASDLGQLADFYQNRGSFSGELSDLAMLDVALANLETERCAIQPTDDNLMQRYENWVGSGDQLPSVELFQAMYNMGCYSGQAVRDKVKEIFGKELQLSDETLASLANPYFGYDAANDEIYSMNLGRGGVFPEFERKLLKAERDGERMYLYETVSVMVPGAGSLISIYDKCIMAGNEEADEANGCNAEDYQWQTGQTRFRWVFKRTNAGNYVFEKIERVERE